MLNAPTPTLGINSLQHPHAQFFSQPTGHVSTVHATLNQMGRVFTLPYAKFNYNLIQ